MNINHSQQLFTEAQTLLPGGVDSPVRAYRAIGGQLLFINRGGGAYLYDVDGNRFVDYVLSWGLLILRHDNPRVVKAISEAAALGTSYGAPSPLEVDLVKLIQQFMPNTVFNRVGTMFTTFFAQWPIVNWSTAKTADTQKFGTFFRAMLENGVYLAPSQFEAGFMSIAHSDMEIDLTLRAAQVAFRKVRG